jgi:hypothetical protein
MRISAENWEATIMIAQGLLKSGYQVLLVVDEYQRLKPLDKMSVTIEYVNPEWSEDRFMLESECYPNDEETLKI